MTDPVLGEAIVQAGNIGAWVHSPGGRQFLG